MVPVTCLFIHGKMFSVLPTNLCIGLHALLDVRSKLLAQTGRACLAG